MGCFDKNGDNVLDKDEFKSLMKCMAKKMMNKDLSDDDCEKKFKMADEDGDGAVVLAEFQAFMKKMMPMMCAMMKCPFFKVTKDMSDSAFLDCVREKLMGQEPCKAHLARMKCIAVEMCCCIKKCCGDMMKAMMSEEGCKLMAEWNLLCFDKNGDNVLDKDEFKSLMKCMAKKMMNKDLSDDDCEKKFKMADADGDGAIVLSEFQ